MMSDFGTMLSLPFFLSHQYCYSIAVFSPVFSLFGCGGDGLVILRSLMLVFILPSSSIAFERTSSGRLFLRQSYRPRVHRDEHRSVVRLNPRFNMRTIHLPDPRSVPPIEI